MVGPCPGAAQARFKPHQVSSPPRWVRQHLPLAMQGLAVVPPLRRLQHVTATSGRIFNYDVTGGHYEDTDFQATGSGGRERPQHHQAGLARGPGCDDAVDLAIQSLYDAADEDSATGGPDLCAGLPDHRGGGRRRLPRSTRGRGGRALRRADRPQTSGPRTVSMPYYVAPEQVMKDPAESAQKGIARGRSLVATTYDVGIAIVAENPSWSLHKISEIYDRIAFGGVGKYNESPAPCRRGSPRRHQGVRVQPRRRRRPITGLPLRTVSRQCLHPRNEAARGRDPGRRTRRNEN